MIAADSWFHHFSSHEPAALAEMGSLPPPSQSRNGVFDSMSELNATAIILHQLQTMNSRLDSMQAEGNERGQMLSEKINDHGEMLIRISVRMEKVEEGLSAANPTLQDYEKTKQRIADAGVYGRAAWKIGFYVIMAAGGVYAIARWVQDVWHWFIGR